MAPTVTTACEVPLLPLPARPCTSPNRPFAARRAVLTALAAVACWAALAGGAEGQTSAATDRAALEALYDATRGGTWGISTNWKTAAPLSQWHGVTTDAAGRVTRLELRNNRLRDHWLWLSDSWARRSLPAVLGSLANLQVLNLSQNDIRGSIPVELGNLANLQVLDLSKTVVTGPIPVELGNLANLQRLNLHETPLSGPIPVELGNLANLQVLDLGKTGVTGRIPVELGNLANLRRLDLSYAWGLSPGPLPFSLAAFFASLDALDIFATQVCAPNAWWGWLKTIEFTGRLCDDWSATIDVAVVYTPAARDAEGGAAEIGAVIDLMVAETNQAYAASGVRHRVELVGTSEVEYVEYVSDIDLTRLADPSDGHMDEAHALRDRVGADLVHLIAALPPGPGVYLYSSGIAYLPGVFGLTGHWAGGLTFAHELGHNLGLYHDRGTYGFSLAESLDPAYGWVNPPATGREAASHRRWHTIMAYTDTCYGGREGCQPILRFSNARQSYNGDPLGAPFGSVDSDGTPDATDAVAVLNATGPVVARWRDHVNRAPVAVGWWWVESLTFGVDDAPAYVEMSSAFRDPDGDPLTYAAVSSSPRVASVSASGSTVTVTPAAAGAATVTVTATDAGGSNTSATQTFFVTVENSPPAAVGALAAVTIDLDEAPVSLEVAGAFRDPDGDLLTLGAVSSAPAVASASVSGSAVMVTPASVGTATVTVTATDAGGSNSSATQAFTVTVDPPNRPPEAAGALGAVTVGLDEAPVSLEVAGAFLDPDGDPLTYAVVSSAPAVASASVSGSAVTVTPAGAGTAVVTVTATDADGLSATQAFGVTVKPPNRPPEAAGALAAVTIDLDEAPVSLEVAGAFRDPDGDLLTLGAVSSAPAVASVSVSGSTVMVTPAGVGTATVTVTATDAGGSNATATQTFTVTVEPPNRPPEAAGALEAMTIGLDEAPVSVDVAGAFRDPDDDPLTYEAVSSAPAVASASVSGSTVTVTPAGAGTAVVRVTATDADGLSATQRFGVRVLRPFTDDPIQPGATPIRAVHFTELRTRIDGLRRAAGLARFGWTDPVLRAGATRVRLVHLLELREALGAAYQASDRTPPPWTDAAPAAGATIPIRAAHLTELRAAVVALERGRRTPGP